MRKSRSCTWAAHADLKVWFAYSSSHLAPGLSLGLLCRLAAYREKVRERAKIVDAEEEKQRLRGQVLGKQVEGPDVDAFMRQLAEVRSRPAASQQLERFVALNGSQT